MLLNGLRDVLQRRKLARRLALQGFIGHALLTTYAKLVVVVSPTPLPAPLSADPDDDAVLAGAVAAHALASVSGDRHLLDFMIDRGIPRLTAPALLGRSTLTRSSSP